MRLLSYSKKRRQSPILFLKTDSPRIHNQVASEPHTAHHMGIISGHQRAEVISGRALRDDTTRSKASERRSVMVDPKHVIEDLVVLLLVEELLCSLPAVSTTEPQVRVPFSFVDLDPKYPHAPVLNDFKSLVGCNDLKLDGVAGTVKDVLNFIHCTRLLHEGHVILDGWGDLLGEECGRAMIADLFKALYLFFSHARSLF